MQPGDGPIVLVLAPTRELAVQIKQECDKFGASSEIKNICVYGGVPKSTQVRQSHYPNSIVILTRTPLPLSDFYPNSTPNPNHTRLTRLALPVSLSLSLLYPYPYPYTTLNLTLSPHTLTTPYSTLTLSLFPPPSHPYPYLTPTLSYPTLSIGS